MDRLARPLVVLVIDEDARQRAHLTSILEKGGFSCASAPPDDGALDLAARVKPRVVLLRESEAASRLREEVGRRAPGARIIRFVSVEEISAP